MPSKAEFYRQMAEQVSTQLVGSWKEWTAFLTTAARLYKYPFHEQMMIYAQRPDATACAEYDLWNEKMGRYVRRGSKGIALVDDSGDKIRLRYVFDISDTGTREHSRTPWLWQLEEQHIGPGTAMLEQNYGVAGDNLAQQLTDVAGKLASEYWDDHQRDFRYIVDGSFLAEYDDYNIEVQFKSAATVSIAYALMLSEQPEKPLGKYGRMRKAYLKEHRPLIYNQLLLTEKLYPHLLEIDETANSRLEQMMSQLAAAAGATEQLKASDPMRWVGLMNTCKA